MNIQIIQHSIYDTHILDVNSGFKTCIRDEYYSDKFETGEYKLLLRPLQKILEPIIHNGKEIIPLIEIAKMSEPYWDWKVDIEDQSVTFNHNDIMYIIEYDNSFQKFNFMLFVEDEIIDKQINSQLEALNKLFEYHFDVYNLIEKGFAQEI